MKTQSMPGRIPLMGQAAHWLLFSFAMFAVTGCQPTEIADRGPNRAIKDTRADGLGPGVDSGRQEPADTKPAETSTQPEVSPAAGETQEPQDVHNSAVALPESSQEPDEMAAGEPGESHANPPPGPGAGDAAETPPDTAADLIAAGMIDAKWKRMDPFREIWLDLEKRQVVLGGRVCFREGMLEMFACPRGTKEHESVVAVQCSARQAHACLLALGCNPGNPVSWEPEYKAASGPEVGIEVVWMEGGKPVRRDAREMVLEVKTGKELQQAWVFGGSRVFTEESTGEEFYCGDGGEFICVSNFTTATLDLPVDSSNANGMLMFEANSQKIPELDTRVLLFLIPPAPPK